MAFAASTQRRRWMTTVEGLAALRETNYREAAARRVTSGGPAAPPIDSGVARVPAAKRARVEADGGGGAAAAAAAAAAASGPLTLHETQLLLRCYEWDIMHACNACGFNRAILATAITFFKRFYLYGAPTEYHPAAIATTSIFLAIKAEACPYTEVVDFCRTLLTFRDVRDSDVVALEVPLLTGLQYHITVYHPYRPLKSLLADMIAAFAERGAGAASDGGTSAAPFAASDAAFVPAWDALQARALLLADVSLTTDAQLLHTPAHIAAACLLAAAQNQSEDSVVPLPRAPPLAVRLFVRTYLADKFAAAAGGDAPAGGAGWDAVVALADTTLEAALRDAAADATLALPLTARLAATMNPAFQRGTAAHDARLRERAREREEYKASKADARRAAHELVAAAAAAASHAAPPPPPATT